LPEPYETISFKVPNLEIDKSDNKFYSNWDKARKVLTMQIYFKERDLQELPALPQRSSGTSLAFHGGGGFTR
jgi:splicing factor 3A subunit 2